jgi:uncharacterized membrane protein YccC
MPRTALRDVFTPYFRYRHSRLIHATRVGFSVLASILLTVAIGLPHSEWTSITVLIVIGGLQHQGNIRQRAVERSFGTLIGAAAGLVLIVQQHYFGISVATYLMIAAACGFCGYHAIGRGGYIALLSAITIIIVAGHGDNSLADGLWRTVNVLIGIGIAVVFSFIIPLHATWAWRYKLAESLQGCAELHAGIAPGADVSSGEDLKASATQNELLVQLRSLMPWVSSIDSEKMEDIQRSLRLSISILDLMVGMRRRISNGDGPTLVCPSLVCENRQIAVVLLGMARALKLGEVSWLQRNEVAPHTSFEIVGAPSLNGYLTLTSQFNAEIHHLRQLLSATASLWNI